MDFVLQGGNALWGTQMVDRDISVSQGLLSDKQTGRKIDARGYIIVPGIVDIHGDGFERHLAPRRGAVKDLSAGLVATEAELAANGITTAVLAQFYSWEGGMRSPAFAADMLAALDGTAPRFATALIPQLRFEYLMRDHWPAFLDLVQRHAVPYVVLNDHVPHSALAKGKKPPRLTGQALKSGRSPDAHLALLNDLHSEQDAILADLSDLTAKLLSLGVTLGSHDDATLEDRKTFHDLGVRISEFPETEAAALAAVSLGSPVIMGAPNMLRGGSHVGNLNAASLVGRGLDALASDYHYPAPRLAALALARDIGFAAAWPYVSANPASILGLRDRGVLSFGYRADMIVLDSDTHQIEATLAKGTFTYLTGRFAQRVLAAT